MGKIFVLLNSLILKDKKNIIKNDIVYWYIRKKIKDRYFIENFLCFLFWIICFRVFYCDVYFLYRGYRSFGCWFMFFLGFCFVMFLMRSVVRIGEEI